MSEIATAPPATNRSVRWLIAVYGVLGVASLAAVAGALSGAPAVRYAAYALAVLAPLTWAVSYIRLRRRPEWRESEQHHQWTLMAWIIATLAANALYGDHGSATVPVLLSALAAVVAAYGAVREAVR